MNQPKQIRGNNWWDGWYLNDIKVHERQKPVIYDKNGRQMEIKRPVGFIIPENVEGRGRGKK